MTESSELLSSSTFWITAIAGAVVGEVVSSLRGFVAAKPKEALRLSLLTSCVLFSAFSFWTIDRGVTANPTDVTNAADAAYRHFWSAILAIWPVAAFSVRPYLAGIFVVMGSAAILLSWQLSSAVGFDATACLFVCIVCLWTFSLGSLIDRFRSTK